MALSQTQINQLNAASAKAVKTDADLKNLAYAKTQGYTYTAPAPVQAAPARPPAAPAPVAQAPTPQMSTPARTPTAPVSAVSASPASIQMSTPARPPTAPQVSQPQQQSYSPIVQAPQQSQIASYQPQQPPSAPAPLQPGYVQLKDNEVDFTKTNDQYENISHVGPQDAGYWIGYKIPTATVIGQNGERVKVRTDNKTGIYRTEGEMLAQGFQKESAPGVAANGSTPGNAALSLNNRPSLITATGQTISPQDPNYTAYEGMQGVRKVSTAPASETPQQTMDRIRAQQGAIQIASGQYISSNDPNIDEYLGKPRAGVGSSPPVAEAPTDPSRPLTDADFGYVPPGVSQGESTPRAYGQSSSDPYSSQRAALDALIKQINDSGANTPEQQQLLEIQKQQRNQDLSTQMGIANISDQPIAATFLQGQSAALQRQAAIANQGLTNQATTLQSQVASAQQQRQAAIDAAKLKLQYETDAADRASTLTQQRTTASRPIEVGGNLVDPVTGRVIYQGATATQAPITQKVGDDLYERQSDGTWKKVAGGQQKVTAPETQKIGDVLYERQADGTWKSVAGSTAQTPSVPKDFDSVTSQVLTTMLQRGIPWAQAFTRVKALYPDVSNAMIDQALGGSYNAATGEATGWARPGAYEEYAARQQQYRGTGTSNSSDDELIRALSQAYGS